MQNRPGKAIVIPEHPSQIRAVDVDLGRVRRSYLRNALNSLAQGATITDTDMEFLVAETKTSREYVTEVMKTYEGKNR